MLAHRIKAFTLFELLVVMLISAILLGIVYYALQIANGRYISYSGETSRLLELKTLVHTMQRDLEKADEVLAEGDRFRCYSQGTEVTYTIGRESIRRTVHGTEEIFPCRPDAYAFSFDGVAIKSGQGPINGIEFTFKMKGETLTFTLNRSGSFYDRFKKFGEAQTEN
jgi:prepilin-type N-terminal cleavage/methylation domain-containing protein